MKQLKKKFILLSMTALLVLLSILVSGMNLLNYRSVVEEADGILSILTHNKGHFPGMGPEGMLPPGLSPEVPYESRFFSVSYDSFGNITHVDVNKIAAVDAHQAILLSRQVLQENASHGFAGDYRYTATQEGDGVRITFLDCGRKLDSFRRFCLISIAMALLGFGVVFVVVFVLSGRIIRPIAESYEKQKRFITDAGHEIKTPLTIIQANADILEMELGPDNESLTDIRSQTRRLKTLTEDLVMLSRMEEAGQGLSKIDFPISDVVEETVQSFQALFKNGNRELRWDIEPMLTLRGNEKAIRQLISILLENALKYSPQGSAVVLKLDAQSRALQLSVSNEMVTAMEPEQLKNVFDRFYRADSSRSSETGGHGIGLSIAKAIVTAHNGKIKASIQNGNAFAVTALFPV